MRGEVYFEKIYSLRLDQKRILQVKRDGKRYGKKLVSIWMIG
jgi:hypothetical protein